MTTLNRKLTDIANHLESLRGPVTQHPVEHVTVLYTGGLLVTYKDGTQLKFTLTPTVTAPATTGMGTNGYGEDQG